MSEITKLRLWNDPGFTDGAVEVPSYDNLAVLPTPNRTIEDTDAIVPSKTRFFNELKIRVPYSEAQFYSYLEMTVEYNGAEHPFVYFGFIDSVTLSSDTEDYPLVTVAFHVDMWRTYLKNARFGSGLVTRRPRGQNDPIQNVTARYRKVSDRVFPLVNENMIGGGAYWAIINYTREDTENETAVSRVVVVPVAKTPSTRYYMKLSANDTRYQVPTLEQWILGEYDEIFELSPKSISSVFLSPIPPLRLNSGTGTVDDPFVVVGPAPSPTPTVVTYDGPAINHPVGVTYNWETNPRVDMSNGDNITQTQWANTPVRSCIWAYSHYTRPSLELNVTLKGVIQDSGGNVLLENAENTSNQITAMPIDEYIRGILGDTVFNTLANGDKIQFSNIYGLYSSGSVVQTFRSELVSNYRRDAFFDWVVTVGASVPVSSELVFNNGTFGSYWVVVDNPPQLSRVTLTTYSQATTTAEYGIEHKQYDGTDYAYLYTKTDRFAEYSASLSSEIATSDTEQFVITDLDGSIVASLPWGLKVRDYTFRCVISATSAYVQFRFDGLNSSAEGLQVSIPLPTLDITSNSWSDYLYSGQRDFDISQRKIARDRALVEGLGGALSQGATGAMLGGLRESAEWMPTTRSIGNASLFGVLGAGAGVAGSLINYASAGYFNDKVQNATDLLQAKQIDAIITPGGGCDWLYYGRPYQVRAIVPDEYSLERFENDVALNGLKVSEPVADCTSLIRGTGPLTIENLIVGGNIPADAKQFIKQKLDKGVRLI